MTEHIETLLTDIRKELRALRKVAEEFAASNNKVVQHGDHVIVYGRLSDPDRAGGDQK